MRQLVFLLLLGLVLRLVLSPLIYSGDVNNHIGWAKSIIELGSRGAYDRKYSGILQPTYPPLALYSFVTSYWLYGQTYSLAETLNRSFPLFPSKIIWFLEDQDILPAFHKIISMVSDLGIAVLIYGLSRRLFKVSSKAANIAAAVYIFNPAVWYNSSLWGQLESPPIFWILFSLWLFLKNRPYYGLISMGLAILFKQSSLIFIPALTIFVVSRVGLKKTIMGILLAMVVFYVSYLPFSESSNPLWPFQVYLHRLEVGSGSDYISDHAFNLWALYSRLEKIPDSVVIYTGLSAAQVGKIAFIGVALIYLLRYLLSTRNRHVIYVLGLTSFAAFMLLTRMHERYLGPVIPFMAITAASKKQLWPIYFLVSLGHLINLYHQWWFPNLPTIIPLVSRWSTIVFVIGLFIVSWLSWTAVFVDETKK